MPLHQEILNKDKTNIGECLFFREANLKKMWVWVKGAFSNVLRGVVFKIEILKTMPLRTSENAPFNLPPEVQIVSQFHPFPRH